MIFTVRTSLPILSVSCRVVCRSADCTGVALTKPSLYLLMRPGMAPMQALYEFAQPEIAQLKQPLTLVITKSDDRVRSSQGVRAPLTKGKGQSASAQGRAKQQTQGRARSSNASRLRLKGS